MSRNDSISGKPTKEFEDGWARIWGNKNERDTEQDDKPSKKQEKPKSSR